jgi:hypothetical protein
MAEVKVPTTQIAELLGLDPGTDEVTVRRALSEWVTRHDADRRAAAARHDDERIVAAAISVGKFFPARRQFYLNALQEDPAGARRVIEGLELVPFVAAANAASTCDPDVERVSAIINGRPYGPAPSPAAAVHAAAAQRTPLSPARDTGQPSVMTNDQLNAQIGSDPELHRVVWAIGGPGGGLKAPPERLTAYPDAEVPWNPKPRIVDHGDGTGHWETPPPDFTMGTGIAAAEADQLARELAHTYNIDLGTVKGTGARGRIKSSDVVEAARRAGRL